MARRARTTRWSVAAPCRPTRFGNRRLPVHPSSGLVHPRWTTRLVATVRTRRGPLRSTSMVPRVLLSLPARSQTWRAITLHHIPSARNCGDPPPGGVLRGVPRLCGGAAWGVVLRRDRWPMGTPSKASWHRVRNWAGLPISVASRRAALVARGARAEDAARGVGPRSKHRTSAR